MFHLSRIPQAKLDALAVILCETVEEVAKDSPMGLIPESHLYLNIQRVLPGLNMDDWQALTMAMRATGRVTLTGNAFRVKVKKAKKAAA